MDMSALPDMYTSLHWWDRVSFIVCTSVQVYMHGECVYTVHPCKSSSSMYSSSEKSIHTYYKGIHQCIHILICMPYIPRAAGPRTKDMHIMDAKTSM